MTSAFGRRRTTRSEPRRRPVSRNRHGLSLVEVAVSSLLVGILLTAALVSAGAAARSIAQTADGCDAVALARQLLEEITVLPYEDPTQTAAFGLESGEWDASGARTSLDDLDDYNNWIDSPPKDRSGNPLAGYSLWQRTVDVQKVNKSSYAIRADSDSDQGLRLVTVVVKSPAGRVTTLESYRTKDADSLQLRGVEQSLVTWVGVTLQSGTGDTVVSGASLVNQATDK